MNSKIVSVAVLSLVGAALWALPMAVKPRPETKLVYENDVDDLIHAAVLKNFANDLNDTDKKLVENEVNRFWVKYLGEYSKNITDDSFAATEKGLKDLEGKYGLQSKSDSQLKEEITRLKTAVKGLEKEIPLLIKDPFDQTKASLESRKSNLEIELKKAVETVDVKHQASNKGVQKVLDGLEQIQKSCDEKPLREFNPAMLSSAQDMYAKISPSYTEEKKAAGSIVEKLKVYDELHQKILESYKFKSKEDKGYFDFCKDFAASLSSHFAKLNDRHQKEINECISILLEL